MKRSTSIRLLVIAIVIAVIGASSLGFFWPRIYDRWVFHEFARMDAIAESVTPHETTMEEIAAELGEPEFSSDSEDGLYWYYEFPKPWSVRNKGGGRALSFWFDRNTGVLLASSAPWFDTFEGNEDREYVTTPNPQAVDFSTLDPPPVPEG